MRVELLAAGLPDLRLGRRDGAGQGRAELLEVDQVRLDARVGHVDGSLHASVPDAGERLDVLGVGLVQQHVLQQTGQSELLRVARLQEPGRWSG